MKVKLLPVLIAIVALGLSGCGTQREAPETLYVLSPANNRVMCCDGKNITLAYELPLEGNWAAEVYGNILYFAPSEVSGSLTRLELSTGELEEWSLPDYECAGPLTAEDADEVYMWLEVGGKAGIYRVNAEGSELLTRAGATPRWPAFDVSGGGLFFISKETGNLVREDLTEKSRIVIAEDLNRADYIGVDSGRVYSSFIYCHSYDEAGGGERLETLFYSKEDFELPVRDVQYLSSAVPHNGWLYYCAPYKSGPQVRLMARRVSDGMTVEYGHVTVNWFYPLNSLLCFGERGFVYCAGNGEDFEDYIYYTYED